MSQCKEYHEIKFDVICLETPVKDLVVTSLSMLILGYNGGLDGLASSRNLKCICKLAFSLPTLHLIAGKRMQLLRRLC